jgi:beta-fructofuranosidase
MSFFYKPGDGWAADVIPFYWQGEYHLFYLKDFRDPAAHGEGTPWYHLSTRDFVTFQDHGEALARGTAAEQDLYVFTGSVIERDGLFHIFYTGHNPHFRSHGRDEQAVMHAVSDDLHTWRKIPADTFAAPRIGYERHDWRDPFVFWHEETQEYWMLLAARLTGGTTRRRGCTALCASPDLTTWEVREPLWSPNLYYTHECPDLFRIGDWWYLLFSEFSQATVTRYRMARSIGGPWLKPANDTFDGRAFYAAKTASDGGRRFLFGWNPTRAGERKDGAWQWGGNMVVHELAQADDGTLTVQVPTSVSRAFGKRVPAVFTVDPPYLIVEDDTVTINAGYSFRAALAASLPDLCRISMTISFADHTDSFGLILHAREDDDTAYFIRFEPANHRLVFDSWPRPGDVPFIAELERPLRFIPETPLTVEVLVDGTVCEVYANGTTAMSARLYPLPADSSDHAAEATPTREVNGHDSKRANRWGLFVSEGSATFRDIAVFRQ